MEIYRELYFKGTKEQLEHFINNIEEYVVNDWCLEEKSKRWKDYLFFDYIGTEVEKSSVSIYIGDIDKESELFVGNIVPLEKSSLSIDEYNAVLLKFYNDIIQPYSKDNTDLTIIPPSNDKFNPLNFITKEALKKLKIFCAMANKATGSSHPSDRERWFDFICQTVDDGRMFDYDLLARFLQDKDYWGKKDENFNGVIGDYAWSKEQAYKLADEYEYACEVLEYYKKVRG
ncbi:hypothetical protein [Intestinibacter bartlettii]|uniref:hypothetical protein n=1 Tax=Intestinibacter bartlettii TaxID=261299 RepID=UPI001106DFB5|nr:hypothetical protein [Intestinibacter bartlettii]